MILFVFQNFIYTLKQITFYEKKNNKNQKDNINR